MSEEEKKTYTVDIFKKKIGYVAPPIEKMQVSREFARIRGAIKKALSNGPLSIPEISKNTGIEMYKLSWFMATLLRYGIVRIAGKDDEGYYKFEWVGGEL